jgi:hypothetical protein
VTIKGTTKVGLNLLITTLHPMRIGATLMSSMLFNVALMLLSCLATIQFCSQVTVCNICNVPCSMALSACVMCNAQWSCGGNFVHVQAFSLYSYETAIYQIFTNQVG